MSPADYSDQTALVQGLFIQHLPALRGFVQSFVRDWALVDDVVQETFTTVNSKAGDFQRGTNFRGWVWTIARFKALQLLEKKPTAGQALAPEVIEALCAQEKAEYWPLADRIEHLGSCMAELAPKARLAVELRYQQAHRPPEIARRMGWSIIEMAVSASAFIPARKATRAAGGTYMVRPCFVPTTSEPGYCSRVYSMQRPVHSCTTSMAK
jgi:RNA polymerase sigma-70 factor (ECF subfamily)